MPKPGYDKDWRRIRLHVLKRDGYRCQVRLAGCRGTATDVDHVDPICVHGPLPADPARLRASCHPCNMKLMGQAVRLKRAMSREFASVGPSREW